MIPKYPILAKLLPIVIFPIFLFGCASVPADLGSDDLLNWKYSDLRALDPSDTQEPNEDLIAIFTRFFEQYFQIRIDFLAFDEQAGTDIYIALDTNLGGISAIPTSNTSYILSDMEWDYLIKISDGMNFSIMNANSLLLDDMNDLVMIDPIQDCLIISLPRSYLPIYLSHSNIQVFTVNENTGQIFDEIAPVAIDASPPPRIKILFAFWNTFSAVTPAETLRSWAGAHSGPMSRRHGLGYLLDAADQTNTAIFILDPLTPEILSALDFIQQIPHIKSLLDRGVLIFPDLGDGQDNSIEVINQWIDKSEDICFSLFLLKNDSYCMSKRNCVFGGNDYAQSVNINNSCSLSYPATDDILLSQFPIECKKLLLSYAYNATINPVIIGGDFETSFFGDPSISKDFFTYIHAHPWLQILTSSDFSNIDPLKSAITSSNAEFFSHSTRQTYQSTIQNEITHSIEMSPENRITSLAANAYSIIIHPDNSDILLLSPEYIGQVGEMIAGANWADGPSTIHRCDVDLDYDGNDECILSNENIFMVIEPEGGYIPFAFSKDDNGIHQFIGPTWEFMLGISDQSEWNPDLGVRADAGQILGAFQDEFTNWITYKATVNHNEVNLISAIDGINKRITLLTDEIRIEINNFGNIQFTSYIPLVVDPWWRFYPGWGDLYIQNFIPLNYSWGIHAVQIVNIQANVPITANTFKDSKNILLQPEDPNYNFPPGHYLPYPMSLAKIDLSGSTSIDIRLLH
jgi:hypothetical protein